MTETEHNPEELRADLQQRYQTLKTEPDPTRQLALIKEFVIYLITLLENKDFLQARLKETDLNNLERLKKIILAGDTFENSIHVGNGSSGRRLKFDRSQQINDDYLETKDRAVGWMSFPEPGQDDPTEYYNRFMELFGDSIVQLTNNTNIIKET